MKALFFSPYGDIWARSLPEVEIAEVLREDGWDIHRITCERDFSGHCISMAAKCHNFTAEASTKRAVCNSCVHRQSLLRKSFGFNDLTTETR